MTALRSSKEVRVKETSTFTSSWLVAPVFSLAIATLLLVTVPASVALASEDYASVSLSFSEPPPLNDPFTLTLAVIPNSGFSPARMEVTFPSAITIQSASPSGYTIVGTVVSWSGLTMTEGVTETFVIGAIVQAPLTDWIDARVYQGSTGDEVQLASGGSMVKVTASGSQVSSSGVGILGDKGPENHFWSLYDEPLTTQFTWDRLPDPGGTATVTLLVTNTIGSSVSYAGSYDLPSGWSVDSGSAVWSETLTAGSWSSHTIVVEADTTEGAWNLSAELDLAFPVAPSYLITQHGRFDGGGVWSERQSRSRPTGNLASVLQQPITYPILTDPRQEIGLDRPIPFISSLITASGARPKPVGPGRSGQNSSRVGEVMKGVDRPSQSACIGDTTIDGRVTINPDSGSLRGASYLGYKYFARRYEPTAGGYRYRDTLLFEGRLNRSGNYEVCFDLDDGYAHVWYFVYSTDAPGGSVAEDWSSRVYVDFGNNHVTPVGYGSGLRTVHSGVPSSWCNGAGNCTFNTEINNDNYYNPTNNPDFVSAEYFRLAAIYASDTRDFMMTAQGPGLGDTRQGGDPAINLQWRAAAKANDNARCSSGACAGYDGYIYIAGWETRASDDSIYLTANHEFGHKTQHWLWGLLPNGEQRVPTGVGGDWTEGWADGFLAALTHLHWGVGYANYNFNRPIECLPATGRLDVLRTAASLLDLWDPAVTETCNGQPWGDPAASIWDDAWNIVDDGNGLESACEFREDWENAFPPPGAGSSAMDHNDLCP